MSSTTDGDTDYIEDGYPLRRPISVSQLLEREGYRPARRSRTTRRALSGVAAGAVLTLGAVVGSLFLGHGTTTTGDVEAAGAQSGGDIVLAESGNQPVVAHANSQTKLPAAKPAAPKATHQAQRTTTRHNTTSTWTQSAGTAMSGGTAGTAKAPQAPTTDAKATAPATQSAPSTQSAPTSTTTTPPSTSTTTDGTGSQAPAPTSTTPPSGSTSTTAPTTTSGNGGGLLGGVGDAVGDLTAPVFGWFG